MAGAGFRTFVDGDILTAAQVNTYLMEQSVMVFADAAARTSAIAAPSEGMVTYLSDNDLIEYYDGSAWQPLLDQDVIAAKGDLIVGTGDDTVAALSVGTNGHVLTADSSTATGLKWAAAAGGGKVLQVVSTTKSDTFSTTSSTFTDLTGLSATLTPASNTNKVLIHVSLTVSHGGQNANLFNLVRGSTAISQPSGGTTPATSTEADGADDAGIATVSMVFLDSPNTTSSTTYKVQCRTTGGTLYVNRINNDANYTTTSTITIMEIQA